MDMNGAVIYASKKKMCGCEDCVETIINILEENNILIDYNDYDFEKWENLAKGE